MTLPVSFLIYTLICCNSVLITETKIETTHVSHYMQPWNNVSIDSPINLYLYFNTNANIMAKLQ